MNIDWVPLGNCPAFIHVSKVWQRDFGGKLRIRSNSQHKKCSTCVKHKLIIAKLTDNEVARRAQIQCLEAHLDRQYKDRICYWERRSWSRLCVRTIPDDLPIPVLSCIMDSMDSSKHSWPRSHVLRAKDFQNFNRPRLTHTAIVCHGRAVYCMLSPPGMPSNSARSVEIISHALTELSLSGTDLRRYALNIQGDNCPKELKNQSVFRMAAWATCTHTVHCASVCFLESGHSHEDVDGFFSNVADHINGAPEVHTADDFVQCIQRFLDLPGTRPHEPVKKAIMIDKCHDWSLNLISSLLC